MIAEYVESTAARSYHHTAPISMIYALHAGLGVLLDEGLEASWARHAECGEPLQDGLERMGFKLFAAEGHRLPELTTVWVPDGIDEADGRAGALLDRYGIEIGGGLGEFAGKVWRIGCMGHTARLRNVDAAARRPRGAASMHVVPARHPHSAARRCARTLFGRRVVLRPLASGLRRSGARCAGGQRDWLTKWEPARIPGAARRRRGPPGVRGPLRRPPARASSSAPATASGSSSTATSPARSTSTRSTAAPFQSAYVGYWIDETLRRQRLHARGGRARAALRVRASCGLHRLQISIIPRNHASRRVVEKLDIRDEGIAVRYLEINGVWEDHIRYAITAEEWDERRDELLAPGSVTASRVEPGYVRFDDLRPAAAAEALGERGLVHRPDLRLELAARRPASWSSIGAPCR